MLLHQNARIVEEQMREHILVDLCPVMSIEEMKKIINDEKRDFKRKTRVNKLMIGKTEEVAKDTEVLKAVLLKNRYNVVFEKMHDEDVPSGPEIEEAKEDTIENTHNPLDMQDSEIPMETKAPKFVSVEEIEIPEAKQESIVEEKKAK